ncbi:DNA polymerase IV [Rosenbergiella australiborealis]|uniref:DNA polymerase IV n=1 Tax=Rosenbergiella australiborealis TaxID=1544696 RepID=A0ABS5T7T1_9GAMM|nr:DNA polymerase IV [Rosenbergiella australiborealis]MBT0728389.1 DNA polymerase IV [Rosenbergiella australiborealis]
MRKIIHVDMDCFYAAVEMRDNPALRDIPIAIGGSRERRGVISTANYPARRYGVKSAMPTATALKLCPQLILLPGRFDAYKQVSAQIQLIFKRYTLKVEPLSLDEAYLDVTECQRCKGSATLIAEEIRRTIFDETGLTASAGVAPIKFLAKIASEINKPDGIYVIPPHRVDSFLQTLPLTNIPGVGEVSSRKLADLGLYTCADVQKIELSFLLKKFGKFGRSLWERSQGIDSREVDGDRQRKSIGVETTLEQDIVHWSQCLVVIEKLYQELERRLQQVRSDRRIARQGVKFKFSDFQQTTQEHMWSELTKQDFIDTALQLWEQRRRGRSVRLIGLHIHLVDPHAERQLPLAL